MSRLLVRIGTLAATLIALSAPAGCASGSHVPTAAVQGSTVSAASVKASTESGIKQKLQQLFGQRDRGGKGYLTEEELPSNPVLPVVVGRPDVLDPETRAALLKVLDKNSDGKISLPEFLDPDFVAELVYVEHDQAAQLMKTLDANNDGFLTREETAITESDEEGPMSAGEFGAMDANRDGKLTAAELEIGLANPKINPLPSAG